MLRVGNCARNRQKAVLDAVSTIIVNKVLGFGCHSSRELNRHDLSHPKDIGLNYMGVRREHFAKRTATLRLRGETLAFSSQFKLSCQPR